METTIEKFYRLTMARSIWVLIIPAFIALC